MNSVSRKWTNKETEFLKDNYTKLSRSEISIKLNRTIQSVYAKLSKLKLLIYKPVIIGERFGRLIVLEKAITEKPLGENFYKCQCDCGKIKIIRGNSLRGKQTFSCGCYNSEKASMYKRLSAGESSYNRFESQCKWGASSRELSYDLMSEQFRNLIMLNCFYCEMQAPLKNPYYDKFGKRVKANTDVPEDWAAQQWVKANGIDRIDNTIGYILNNCVPCCTDCNFAKGSMNFYDWISLIERFQPGFVQKILIKLQTMEIKLPENNS